MNMDDATRFPPSRTQPVDNVGASYCCECDAASGECDHGGPRYLAPIRYELTGETPDGRPIWGVPERERWRVDHPPSTWDRDASARVDYGPRAVETFAPITTALAEHVRQTGLRVLGARYRELSARARRRPLTAIERSEMDKTERAIGQLEAMAPIAPLQAGQKAGPLGIVDPPRPD